MVESSAVVELVLALSAFAVVLAAGVLFARSPEAAAWVLVLGFVATQAMVSPLATGATVMGYSIYALDPVTSVMLVIGVLGLVQRPCPRALSFPLLSLSALLLLHVAWGAATIGLQAAVTVARPWLYVVGPLVYAAQAVPRWTRESFRPLIFGAIVLSGYVVVWIAQNGLRGANTYIEQGGDLLESRALTGVGVLFVLFCVMIAVSGHFVRSAPWWWTIALMGGAVVLAQYRTVWIVAALSIAVAYVHWARRAIFSNEEAALGAASAILLALPFAAALAVSSTAFGYSARTSVGANTTLTWRFESWRGALESHHSIQDLLLGLPAGTEIAREIGGVVTTHSVHSLYLDALFFFGMAGVLCLLYIGLQIVRFRHAASAALGISPTIVALVVVGTAIFGLTTMLGAVEGLLLGMLLQGASLGMRAPAPSMARHVVATRGSGVPSPQRG